MTAPGRLAYTREQLAEATGLSVDTIKRAIAAGQLRTVSPVKGKKGERVTRVLITADEAQRWLAA